MYTTDTQKIYNRLVADAETVNTLGHEVFAVFLQGSQNYQLDYEGSDIDTKALILPEFSDLVRNNKPVSFTHVLPSDEHIDIKDMRAMFDVWRKQNIQFLEVLFTPYAYLNPKYADLAMNLIENREFIAHVNPNVLMNCIEGVMKQKQHALKHPYPACADEIEAFGYSAKQLHHIVRLKDFMIRYAEGEDFETALIANNRDELIHIKSTHDYTADEATQIADAYVQWAEKFNKAWQSEHPQDMSVINQNYNVLDKLLYDTLDAACCRYYQEEWGIEQQREADKFEDPLDDCL